MNKVYLNKMDIEKSSIIYEEINEKNKNLFENFEKNKNHTYGIISLRDEETEELQDYAIVKYCRSRNLCRLYEFNNKIFDKSDSLEYCLNVIETILPADSCIWYCDDDIDYLLEMGFKNPYYCNYDPFHEKVAYNIGVSKINDPSFETNKRDRYIGSDSNPYDFQQRRTSPVRNTEFTMFDFVSENINYDRLVKLNIKFNKEDLSYLKKLVYSGRTLNEDGTMTQKEVSGVLYLQRKSTHFELLIDKTKNFNAHDEEKVRFVNGLINFHTHPLDVYNTYGIDLMYPSPADYISILTYLIQKHSFERESLVISPLLFSCVVTLEGIYIISLNKNYCLQEDLNKLRDTIAVDKGTHYELKRGIKESIDSKLKGLSGYFYGKSRNVENYYDTHIKYIGDPENHPLGYTQIGGFDYDTFEHNRKESQLTHFPEVFENNGYSYSRIEQAARDYCLKINRRDLISGTKFENGPVIRCDFYTYDELEEKSFNIYVSPFQGEYISPQLLLCEQTICDIKYFFNQK